MRNYVLLSLREGAGLGNEAGGVGVCLVRDIRGMSLRFLGGSGAVSFPLDSIYPCSCYESGERVSFITSKYVSPYLSCGFGDVKKESKEGGGLTWFGFPLQSEIQSSFGNCFVGCVFNELIVVIEQ